MRTVRSIPQYTTILSQAMSKCGSFYAAASIDGNIAVWRTSHLLGTEKRNPIVRFRLEGSIYSLHSISDYLLVGRRDKVTAFDWAVLCDSLQWTPCWEVELAGEGEVNSMATGSEDRLVLGMADTNVYLVDVETRRVVRKLSGHSGYIHSVATSDNVMVSGGEDGDVRVWDALQHNCVHTLRPCDNSELARPKLGQHVSSVAVSNDWLACGGGPAPAIWHLKSMAMATTVPFNDNTVNVVRFHDDNVFVAGRGRVLFQGNISGELKAEVEMSSSVIYDIAMKNDPNLMCCAGSSSMIDVLSNNFNYKDATIEFLFKEDY